MCSVYTLYLSLIIPGNIDRFGKIKYNYMYKPILIYMSTCLISRLHKYPHPSHQLYYRLYSDLILQHMTMRKYLPTSPVPRGLFSLGSSRASPLKVVLSWANVCNSLKPLSCFYMSRFIISIFMCYGVFLS